MFLCVSGVFWPPGVLGIDPACVFHRPQGGQGPGGSPKGPDRG